MRVLIYSPLGPVNVLEADAHSLLRQGGFTDLMFSFDNPYPTAWPNIQLNYEKMRRLVLNEGYSKVLVVESDMKLPQDALTKLMSTNAPIVTGVYVLRHGAYAPNLMDTMNGPGSTMDWRYLKQMVKKGVKELEVSGGCMGCVLIDRVALEGFSMEIPGYDHAPDMPWMKYCWGKFKTIARLDVLCGHVEPDGTVLWPQDYMKLSEVTT